MAREGAAVYTESLKKTRIQHLAQIDDHVERHHGVDLSDGGNSGLLNTIRNQIFHDLKAVFFYEQWKSFPSLVEELDYLRLKDDLNYSPAMV